jgi:hypothetical protein
MKLILTLPPIIIFNLSFYQSSIKVNANAAKKLKELLKSRSLKNKLVHFQWVISSRNKTKAYCSYKSSG